MTLFYMLQSFLTLV
uniref:Uncharacterized protein n=1 Tax=Arundo donax TaxID=35708 RepID=A0A0A9ELS8_ARUDO